MHLRYALSMLVAFYSSSLALPQPTPTSEGLRLSLKVRKVDRRSDKTIDKRDPLTGSVAAVPANSADFDYMMPMQIGSQTFEVQIDTGSSTFWLLSNQLPPSSTGAGHPIYTPTSPAVPLNNDFMVSYDGGDIVSGHGYADRVVMGPATVTSQAVGAVASANFVRNTQYSGLIGLSFGPSQAYAGANEATFMANLNKQLASQVFTLDLNRDGTGTLEFGFIDSAKYSGSIAYVARDTGNNQWRIAPGTYMINGTPSSDILAPLALLDSGTSEIVVPQAAFNQYFAAVPGAIHQQSSLIFPCSHVTDKTLPSFSINLGGQTFTIPSGYMWAQHYNATYCWSALTATSGSNAVLGDMFHRTAFVVHDYSYNNGQGRVGIAAKASLEPAPTP